MEEYKRNYMSWFDLIKLHRSNKTWYILCDHTGFTGRKHIVEREAHG